MDGAWLQQKIVDAVVNSPEYHQIALIISYDETDGWGDHVPPSTFPRGTDVELIEDPETSRYVLTGPGFRVPFYVITPFTRGGHVFTEPADHTSQLKLLEKWVQARFNKNVTTPIINSWRREYLLRRPRGSVKYVPVGLNT